jgi:hypothetical protein
MGPVPAPPEAVFNFVAATGLARSALSFLAGVFLLEALLPMSDFLEMAIECPSMIEFDFGAH